MLAGKGRYSRSTKTRRRAKEASRSNDNPAPKLRALRSEEVRLLSGLWTDAGLPFRPKGRDSLQNLREQRRNDPELFVGAFLGGSLVGAVIASDDGRKGWINRLAVLPSARGKGIAAMLVRYCEDILRRRGRLLLCVHIEGYNKDSMKMFESLGYSKEEDIFYYTKRESPDY
jgi:ribosomal protein S18 acetylase RimI-like enzyme